MGNITKSKIYAAKKYFESIPPNVFKYVNNKEQIPVIKELIDMGMSLEFSNDYTQVRKIDNEDYENLQDYLTTRYITKEIFINNYTNHTL